MLYRLLFAALILALIFGAAPVRAQDDPLIIRFDEPLIVTLTPGAVQQLAFVALAGDRFELRLLALAPVAYSATLIDPLQALAPLAVDGTGNAVLAVDPATRSGRYTLVIDQAAASGDLVIQLTAAANLPEPLPFNAETITLLAGNVIRFRLDTQPDYLETLLTMAPLETGEGALPRVVLIDPEDSRVIAELGDGSLPGAALRLPGDRSYFLALEPGPEQAEIALRWEGTLPAPAAAPDGGPAQVPGGAVSAPAATPTPEASLTATPSATPLSTLMVTATLTPDPDATATPIPSPTPRGLLAGTATDTPSYTPTRTPSYTPSFTPSSTPPGATATYTLTHTPTYTPGSTRTLTLTYTPSYTPTWTPTYTPSYTPTRTPTYTPSFTPSPPVPEAAPDANFNAPLNIPLDSTASTTDFVSYPGGDREDRVRFDITGMNPNPALSGGRARLVITASCFGTGTQNIQFFTGGQTYSCGQTLVDREVTYDSRTGQVTITATGGTSTYVQWVLTGSATRLN